MKKLPLLVALSLFTLGTATMVKAQETDVTLPADGVETSEEVVPEVEQETAVEGFLDENNNGIDDTLEDPSSLEASDSEVPADSEGMKENLKEGLKNTEDTATTDADGDGVTADQDQDDSDPTVGAAE